MNQLDALKKYTTVVVDSGDIESINKYSPEDVTTNPSLILNVINLPNYQNIICQSVDYAKKKGGNYQEKIINATDKIAVNIGAEIIKIIPGYISTEVDARLSFNREKCIQKAKKMIQMYEEVGINRSRILIKLAATWECIRVAEELKKSNINCNLTLLFSFFQARACAEAGVFLISPFVGRIYDWYQIKNPVEVYSSETDPGVISVRKIYKYYKKYNYNTIIMGASFRNINQVLALSGCDRLTISPVLLEELLYSNDPVQRCLYPPTSIISMKPTPLTKLEFYENHKKDSMAVEKLSEGIRNFGCDQEKLEKIISLRF